MKLPKTEMRVVIIGLALLSPIVSCLVGWGLGAAVWRAERPGWVALDPPPVSFVRIEGIAFPEDDAYAPPTVYLEAQSGDLWFYRPFGAEGERWVPSNGGCTPCGGWLQQSCGGRDYSFLPDPPARMRDCAESLPDLPDEDPEGLLTRYIIVEDGSVWRWARPAQLIGARQIYPACGLMLGILGGAALGLFVLRGLGPASDDQVQS